MRPRQGALPAPQRRRRLLRPPQTLPRTRHPLRKTRRSLPERGDHRQPHLVAQPRSTKQALAAYTPFTQDATPDSDWIQHLTGQITAVAAQPTGAQELSERLAHAGVL